MNKVLGVLRGLFLAGTASLAVCLLHPRGGGVKLFVLAVMHRLYSGVFSLFFLVSPILYIILVLISVAYKRKNGQPDAADQTQSVFADIIRCMKSDLISPFKCIRDLGDAFDENVSERSIQIRRFIGLVLLIFFCSIGLGTILR